VVDKFRREGGLGLNITAPFKLDAFAYCTDLNERARLAGAVNAMKFEVDRVTERTSTASALPTISHAISAA
jgi:shikimate dehydrogenase